MAKQRIKQPAVLGGKFKLTEVSVQGSTNSKNPLFSFEYLSDEYCISKCENEDKLQFVNKLRVIGKQTWQQLTQNNKHGTGFEKIASDALLVAIPRSLTEDCTFIAFRFSDKKPMIGFRRNEVFYIVWIDPTFQVYKH